jgi:hypothetical protein
MAQNKQRKFKIAVFAPVYIDSAFDGDNYKLGNNNLPKSILPGLEFYNGVMMAIDSLQTENAPVEVSFYDTKSKFESMDNIISEDQLNDVSLIIASFNNRSEIRPLADFALKKKIPLLSVTFPNDGGITGNPYFILINSTLRTHLEELYRFIQRYYSTGNIVLFRRKGPVEDMIQSVFGEMGRTTTPRPLKIKTVELPDLFTNRNVWDFLDSTKKNIVICGTIDEVFGLRLIKALNTPSSHKITVIGMPTWDGFKALNKTDGKNIEIVYSTPYNFSKTDKSTILLTQKYRTKFNARPSDMVFKGFESMYHFSKLMMKHDTAMIRFLSDKSYQLFNNFDIRAVRNKSTHNIDYLENRKLYFIKKVDGVVKQVY